MTLNEYQRNALRTAGTYENNTKMLLNGLMGLNGEAGECIDILKKNIFQGHEFNHDDMINELGDVLWYLAISADAIGASLSEIAEHNVQKLTKRYPDGFSS